MAVRDRQSADDETPALPDAVPLSLSHLTRMSCELGTQTVHGEGATRLDEWVRADDRWALSLFEVTEETALIRVRTPVGRKRFYGTLQSELEAATRRLDDHASWHRVD